MRSGPSKSPNHSHLPLIGYVLGLVGCLAIWTGIFTGTRYMLNGTSIGTSQVANVFTGLSEGRSTAPTPMDCQ
jgi:hypothetical protein